MVAYGEVWLNDTLATVGCYVAGHVTSTSTDNQTSTAMSGIEVSQTDAKATTITENFNGVRRGQSVELWVVAVAGLVVVAVNSLQW